MSDIGLTQDGDLLFVNGSLVLVTGGDAIIQNLTIRLQFFLGEWFLDTRLGMPYFQDVLVKNPNLVLVRGIFRVAITSTPGVKSLEEFEFAFDSPTRKLRLDFIVRRTDNDQLLDYSKVFIIPEAGTSIDEVTETA